MSDGCNDISGNVETVKDECASRKDESEVNFKPELFQPQNYDFNKEERKINYYVNAGDLHGNLCDIQFTNSCENSRDYWEFECRNKDTEQNKVDYMNGNSCDVWDNLFTLSDDMDNQSEYSVWSVSYSDDENDECFFTYGDNENHQFTNSYENSRDYWEFECRNKDTDDWDNHSTLSDDWDNQSECSVWSVSYSDDENDECFFTYGDNENHENVDDAPFAFSGKRIVDLNLVFDEIKKMNVHSVTCNFNDMTLAEEEYRNGFISTFRFICTKCSYVHVIKTAQNRNDQFNLNYESVLGAMTIGIGYSQLEEFTGILDMPCISSSTFQHIERKVGVDLAGAANQSMISAAEEEKEYARHIGKIDGSGMPHITCVCDCAWCKRSYRTNYNASSGSVVIIGHKTHKVLWQGVANKYCRICKKISSSNKEPYEHECNRNYDGPSTGMEPKLVVDGFKECEEKLGFRISELIGDGDSSVMSEILKANIYRNPTLTTKKTECCNHLFRNTRGNLRKLGEKGFLKRFITVSKIEDIIKAIRCAAKHWNEQPISMDEKISNLRDDIYNVPFHIFGSHVKCNDYFCKKKNSDDVNLVEIMQANNSFNPILAALSRARLNARSILLNENTNIAEQFNSLIVKCTGGKRIDFSKSDSFNARTKLAVLQHNTGRSYSALCEFMNMTPNSNGTKNEFRRLVKKLWFNNRERTFHPKTIPSGIDKNYGQSSCARPDMDAETFKYEEKMFFQRLNHNQTVRDEIQEKTIGQTENTEWSQYRADLLTASKFGRICCARSPESYTGIVKEILYTDISHLKQVLHGSLYEKNAIKKLEDSEQITVKKCGLFIDSEFCFLGASPDGMVGDRGIAEVKCPFSNFEKDIEESILNGTLNVWSRQRKPRKKGSVFVPRITGINRRHKWFYQVQGQLHITQKDFCYFAVWVGDNFPIRIEKIYRDDDFWEKQMQDRLTNFYYSALLPEIIDPRMSRSMPLRRYDKKGNCIA